MPAASGPSTGATEKSRICTAGEERPTARSRTSRALLQDPLSAVDRQEMARRHRTPWSVVAAGGGAVALLLASRSPVHGWWSSPWAQLWLVTAAAAACLVLAAILLVVGWRQEVAEIGLLGTSLTVLSGFAVVQGVATPGALSTSSHLAFTAAMLALPSGLAAGAPMLAPRASLSRWIALRWRGWALAWLAAAGAALTAAWFAPDRLLAAPGSPLGGLAMAVALAGAGVLAARHLRLYRIGHDRASLVTGVAIAYLAGIMLVGATLATGSPAWWLAHTLDASAVLAAATGALLLARSHRSLGDLLAPVLSRDPLSALEVGLSPEVHAFVAALAKKDRSTRDHVVRVAELTARTAVRAGMPASRLRAAGLAALLHDIGKLVVPSAVLTKAGRLTDEELAEIKTHAARGAALLRGSGVLSPVADLVRWHHERHDARGYPDGLRGEEIPFEVALISVCDAWDAMTNDRHYRTGMGDERARAILEEGAGTQWHPRAVRLVLEELAAGAPSTAFAATGLVAPRGEAAQPASVCPDALRSLLEDLDHRTGPEAELQRSHRRFRAVFEHAPIGMLLVGADGTIRQVNRALAALVARDPAAVVGTRALELVQPEDIRGARRLGVGLQRRPQAAHESELHLRRSGGDAVPIHVVATVVEEDDGSPCYLVQVVDTTERRRVEEELRQLALVDELTGLCNRRGLLALGGEVARKARLERLAVRGIFVDLDRLKLINDRYGHSGGDLALRDLGSVLASFFREADVVARLGGDEFFVLSTDDAAEADTIAARLDEALAAHVRRHRRPYRLSVSVGVTGGLERHERLDDLLARADQSMYEHKRRLSGTARP